MATFGGWSGGMLRPAERWIQGCRPLDMAASGHIPWPTEPLNQPEGSAES